jgi:predicted transcriptional regulator
MDFVEKARIRLENWTTHNDQHMEEYDRFADQLEQAGKKESANHVREMIQLTSKGTECLRKALAAL